MFSDGISNTHLPNAANQQHAHHQLCTAGLCWCEEGLGLPWWHPSNLGVSEGGVLIHNAFEQPEAKQRHSRTVNLGQVPYSGNFLAVVAPSALFG